MVIAIFFYLAELSFIVVSGRTMENSVRGERENPCCTKRTIRRAVSRDAARVALRGMISERVKAGISRSLSENIYSSSFFFSLIALALVVVFLFFFFWALYIVCMDESPYVSDFF